MSMPDPNTPDPEPGDPEPENMPGFIPALLTRDVPGRAVFTRDAPITASDRTARTVTARLVRYNDPHDVVDVGPAGAHRYREQFAPESIAPAARMHVVDAHDGNLIGHIGATRDEPDGFYGDLVVADTSHGRDLMALVDSGAISSVSMEFAPGTDGEVWTADRSAVTRTRATVFGAAFAFRPAHDAPILAVREAVAMPDVPIPVAATEVPTPTITATPATADLDALRRELMTLADTVRSSAPAGHPAARFRSLNEYIEAAWTDHAVAGLMARALVDQVTGDNPGVVPPGWLQTIMGIVSRGAPSITALGGPAGLPNQGMSVHWPYYAGDLKAIVAAQAGEKTAIHSVKVSFAEGSTPLVTYAGGSDVSYQLIRRSSPSYQAAYLRILTIAYAITTDVAFGTVLHGLTGNPRVAYDPAAADPSGALLRGALFHASALVQAATGLPATAVLCDTASFIAMGSAAGLYPGPYGTNNVSGTATASTLAVNVSGLSIVHDPYLPAGTIIVTNEEAARWYGEGPFTVTADDVEKLGQNIAVWGMGAGVVFLPAGVVYLTPTGAVRGGSSSSK